ncbi:Grx4 family monothiol glutaredoxin [Candidatus Woesearchaeota archaeon]|nr:Grx4 family monothiol glutaredoxin [Candidatus Woesearchaeota archaeon]
MEEQLKNKIQEMINSNKVFLFMKGTPEQPRCGFSMQVKNVLEGLGVKFGSFDVLSDEEVREGIKEFSNWPTIPQLYIDGKFVGGCDITLKLMEEGTLKEMVN